MISTTSYGGQYIRDGFITRKLYIDTIGYLPNIVGEVVKFNLL